MPTLELLNWLDKRADLPNVSKYGFNTEFFREFDEIVGALEDEPDLDIEGSDKIKSKILRTGSCPNESRVYYTISGVDWRLGTADESIDDLLGSESNIERREAGQVFERWIDNANEALNLWLKARDQSGFVDPNIPSAVSRFYLSRLDEIEEKCKSLGIDTENIQMDVQYEVETSKLGEQEPDGVWLNDEVMSYPGGVFESKLAVPYEPGIRDELTGYAVHIEREQDLPIEFGVFLYLDNEYEQLIVAGFHIRDKNRDEVKQNIQRLSQLIFRSKIEPQWDSGGSIQDRLVKPNTPDYSKHCSNCPYEWECQWEKHITSLESIPRSLKLGGDRLVPSLKAIKQGESNRETVINEVMKLFDSDISEKSAFRGMVLPTTEKLGFVRSMRNGQVLFLSPNGRAVIFDDDLADAVVSRCLRDHSYLNFNLYAETIAFYDKLPEYIREHDANLYEGVNRYNRQFLEKFDVDLPKRTSELDDPIATLYKGETVYTYLTEPDKRREWFRKSLPSREQIQMEEARWKMLQSLLSNDMIVTTSFVDKALWREWTETNSVIDLFEGSTFTETKLIKDNTPYDGVLLRTEKSE